MHALEAAQGFQIHAVTAHRQILALDQRKAEIARQIGVFEIGFVVRPRGEQDDVRLLVAVEGGEGRQAFLLLTEKVGQMLHVQFAELVWKCTRNHQTIFQRIARTGRCLGAIGNRPPAAIRRARQVDRVVMQPDLPRRLNAATGPQIAMLPVDQRRWQQAFCQHTLLAVQIRQQGIQQTRALRHRHRHALPFVLRQDQRQRVQRPRSIRTIGVGIDVVGNAVLLDASIHKLKATAHLFGRDRIQMAEELSPMRAHRPIGGQHFVVASRAAWVNCQKCAGHAARKNTVGSGVAERHASPARKPGLTAAPHHAAPRRDGFRCAASLA